MSKITEWVKDKVEDTKAWMCAKRVQLAQWAEEHPDQAATVVVMAVGATGAIIKGIAKGARLQKEAELKDQYVYDRSLGSYWHLRRKPTQNEQLQIEAMKKSGMKYGEIFTRLRLL